VRGGGESGKGKTILEEEGSGGNASTAQENWGKKVRCSNGEKVFSELFGGKRRSKRKKGKERLKGQRAQRGGFRGAPAVGMKMEGINRIRSTWHQVNYSLIKNSTSGGLRGEDVKRPKEKILREKEGGWEKIAIPSTWRVKNIRKKGGHRGARKKKKIKKKFPEEEYGDKQQPSPKKSNRLKRV